jgi:glycosyltransferase involved in cell wall biosynthesis
MFSDFDHLIVTRWYPTNKSDTIRTNAISSLIRSSLSDDFKVLVIVPREDVEEIKITKISTHETVVTLPWSRIPGYFSLLSRCLQSKNSFFFRFNKFNRQLKKLQKLLLNLKVKNCTVHGNLFTHGFILNSLNYYDFTFVCHEADVESKDTYHGVKFFSNNVKQIGFRSTSIKNKILEKYSEFQPLSSLIVRSGIPDLEMLHRKSYKSYSDSDVTKLVTVARLIPRKNIDKTLLYLSYIEYKWTLDVYGDGPELDYLLNYAMELGISDKVTFHGKIDRSTLINILNDFDIFILISKNETLGLCYLEALSKGLFVIGSSKEGIADYIEDKINGVLVDPNSQAEFIKAFEFFVTMSKPSYDSFKNNIHLHNKNLLHSVASSDYKKNTVYFE